MPSKTSSNPQAAGSVPAAKAKPAKVTKVDARPHLEKLTTQQAKTILVLAISTVVAVISAISAIVIASRRHVEVISATDRGVLIQPVPVSKPYINEAKVQGFAEECLRKSFAHDFKNFAQTLTAALPCYTQDAGNLFAVALDPILTNQVKAKRMVMTPVIVAAPVVVKASNTSDGYRWIIRGKVQLQFEGTTERLSPATYAVELSAIRVPLEENPRGVLLNNITFKPDAGV
jgi:hypothetical protein